jgi:hypothetical protein
MPATSSRWSIRRLLSSVKRLAARLAGRESAWDRVSIRVPERAFGRGSERPFAAYFQGVSSVRVSSIDDIVAWLQTCEYVSDLDLFHERDVWQHPAVFERRRRGDCEDFALWAWRKLAELGIDAEFCVGRVVADGRPEMNRYHAWVVYRVDGTEFLFEPAARTPSNIIRPLAAAMGQYVPHFAVNHQLVTNAFVGCASDPDRGGLSQGDPTLAV